ncbi:hypothetical protein [Lewinella sp. W8]|uniref:hypothetical protein n=1 Tax=Lewinella sp. W8 TaxID=2528208 RepID=UPI0010689FA2|nr:hypothetical protein [Lewinella sp. W8]MTB50090.1 hypothetical protein [Lewinella sp. W8]
MGNRKIIAWLLLAVGLSLSMAFFWAVEFPQGLEAYLSREYYGQFGPLVISVELLIAGYYLLVGDEKTNFTLALFGFTALLDPIFDHLGLFDSLVPLYGTITLLVCGLLCLWLAFANPFKLKRLSYLTATISVVLGVLVEWFFNFP